MFDLAWFIADGPTVTHRQIHATHSLFLMLASTQRCINIQQLHIYSAISYNHPHKNLKLWLMNMLDFPHFSLVFTWVYRLEVMTIGVQHLFYCIIIHIHYNKSIILLLLCLLLELNLQIFFCLLFSLKVADHRLFMIRLIFSLHAISGWLSVRHCKSLFHLELQS